ncbi:hypothetical protein [Cryobacterium sp. Y57]|uniref:hypothetical protein n=1 Tax=Cryobacterium sp. Y57 TaxID=2048287 RepID=UPI0018EC1540|nr:hypothetical protein [Cryobacterium sp. Y57]
MPEWSASRRRVRGFGAAQIIVTMLLTNFNLRKIAAFISDKIKDGDSFKRLMQRCGRGDLLMCLWEE